MGFSESWAPKWDQHRGKLLAGEAERWVQANLLPKIIAGDFDKDPKKSQLEAAAAQRIKAAMAERGPANSTNDITMQAFGTGG
jgi:hypothetical protein